MKTGLYRHYKGGIYLVIAVGAHSETDERLVVYVSLDATRPGPRVRIRPLDGPEGWNTSPEGQPFLTQRFQYIGDEMP